MEKPSFYQLFSQEENFDQQQIHRLRQCKSSVFLWLKDMVHNIAILQTERYKKEHPKGDVSALMVGTFYRPSYGDFSFYWRYYYGCLDVCVNIQSVAWYVTPSWNVYRVLGRSRQYDDQLAIYLASQVDEAIKLFLPYIKQENKIAYCSSCSSSNMYRTASPCVLKDEQWLCFTCAGE